MLFTDSTIITRDNLRRIDPDIPEIEENEGTAIDGSYGVGRQAWAECGNRLLDVLRTVSGGGFISGGGVVSTLRSTGLRARLNQVVVSGPLRLWMLHRGLAMFYSTVAGRRQSDRYQSKADAARRDAEAAWKVLKASGIPVCWNPLPRPGADHEFSGTWGTENLVVSAGGAFAAQETISVAVTWLDAHGVESDASEIETLTLDAGQRVTVNVSTLITPGTMPPRPFSDLAGAAMLTATGWNVYAGPSQAAYLNQQNTDPLALGATFEIANSPAITTAPLMNGQAPDVYLPIQNILPRS